jgi:cytochrome c biogenesis protein CcmG, thiol:disulfide interchange protein DsbE
MNISRTLVGGLFAVLMSSPVWAVDVGGAAPDFTLPVLSGDGDVSLSAHKGKVVYVDFWASWCPPCLKSFPQLNKLRNKLNDQGFEVIGINVDQETKDATNFIKDHPVDFVLAKDPEGETPEKFGLQAMPTSYLVDAQGKVIYVHEGFRDGDIDEIEKKVKAALKGQ